MRLINIIAWILLVVGGLNWLFVGAFAWNLVGAITFGADLLARIIYILVGLSAIWLIIVPISDHGRISLWDR